MLARAALFSDRDVDEFLTQSHDSLTYRVVQNGAFGHATFDAAGNLRYHSIDALEGSATDHVTVQAVDSFGLVSAEQTLTYEVTDAVPSCQNGLATTDAATPIEVHLSCSLTPPVGYHQLRNLVYSIVEGPDHGRLTEFDSDAGVATFVPDPGYSGPVTMTLAADNNGAVREVEYSILVEPAR